MALVEVEHGRLEVERAQREHAAEAEQDLLADAGAVVTAVELAGELPISYNFV